MRNDTRNTTCIIFIRIAQNTMKTDFTASREFRMSECNDIKQKAEARFVYVTK